MKYEDFHPNFDKNASKTTQKHSNQDMVEHGLLEILPGGALSPAGLDLQIVQSKLTLGPGEPNPGSESAQNIVTLPELLREAQDSREIAGWQE